MLKVLADAEKVSGEVVVEEEVFDIILDLCGGFGGVVLQSGAISYFDVELLARRPNGKQILAGCQCFVFLDEREQVEWHLIIAAPRNVREHIIYDSRHNIHVLAEHGGRVDSECSVGRRNPEAFRRSCN